MAKKTHIKKPFAQRIFELSQSLRIIYDCLSLIKRGQHHQIIPLSGQLRALLTDTATPPLLFVIGAELKEKLNFYAMETAEIPIEGLILAKRGSPFSLEQELPGQNLVDVNDFMDDDVITGNNSCSMRAIIDWYANKAGGAHYSPDMPKDMVELLASGFGEAAMVDALFEFGEVIYKLGQRLFKKVVNADVHLLLQIPKEVEKEAFVIHFKDVQSQMGLSLRVFPKINLIFEVQGLAGQNAGIGMQRVIDWVSPHHLKMSIELEDNLDTSLALYVDGECVAKSTFPKLVIIANEPSIYDMYMNRSAENPDAGLAMACAHLMIYNSVQSALDKARTLVWFAETLQDEEITCTYFEKGGYAHKARGQNEFTYFGKSVRWDMKKLSNGEKPR